MEGWGYRAGRWWHTVRSFLSRQRRHFFKPDWATGKVLVEKKLKQAGLLVDPSSKVIQ